MPSPVTGVLDQIRRAIALGGAEKEAMRRRLGEGYTALARETPGFFVKGPEPGRTPYEIARKYGVLVDPTGNPKTTYQPHPSVATAQSEYPLHLMTGRQLMNENTRVEDLIGDVVKNTTLGPLLSELSPDARYAYISAVNSQIGGGQGKMLYPAAIDLARYHDATVVPDPGGLTKINELRRNLNSIPAVIRHGRSDVIYPAESQLQDTRDLPSDVTWFNPEEQVGTYLMNAALQIPEHLASPLNFARLLQGAARPEGIDALDWLRPSKSSDYAQWGPLSALADPATFTDLTQQLRGVGAQRVGESALRKLFITDALSRGEPINPDLLQGLEYRRGGLVSLHRTPPRRS